VEIRSFQHVEKGGLLQSLRKDDFVQIDLSYFF